MAVSYVKKKKRTIPLEYWEESRRPWACLVFLTPLLVMYEVGVWFFAEAERPNLIRNGADTWMRSWLSEAGLHESIWMPLALCTLLFLWHLFSMGRWKISISTLVGMLAESLLFAMGLIVLGQLQGLLFPASMATLTPLAILTTENLAQAITFIGAGIYEEFLFRLCLLPMCYGLFRLLRMKPSWSTAGAIIATSLMFSSAHYIGAAADQFQIFSFVFRAIAGGFFACLFCFRGFGITVGCHATYDLLVGLLMALSINS